MQLLALEHSTQQQTDDHEHHRDLDQSYTGLLFMHDKNSFSGKASALEQVRHAAISMGEADCQSPLVVLKQIPPVLTTPLPGAGEDLDAAGAKLIQGQKKARETAGFFIGNILG